MQEGIHCGNIIKPQLERIINNILVSSETNKNLLNLYTDFLLGIKNVLSNSRESISAYDYSLTCFIYAFYSLSLGF